MHRRQFLAGLVLTPGAARAQGAGLPSFPVETVHSDADRYIETVHATGTGWFESGTRPEEYQMGTAPTAGSLEPEAFVIKARPMAEYGQYGTMMQMHPPGHFLGKRIRLTARLKSEDVRRAQLWLRVDGRRGAEHPLSFYNMGHYPVRGTTDWRYYQIVLDVPQDAVAVAYGFFLSGMGIVWMDGLTLEAVGDNVPVTTEFADPRVTEP